MKKIIIADDNKTFLMYLGLLLKRLDFEVMPVENGLEVLRLSRMAPVDLILLDIDMKVMDGFSVLRHLREDKQTAQMPVIMLSGDSGSETMGKCKALGCYDYLTKPLRVDKLHDSLQRCFFSQKGTNRRFLRASYKSQVVLIQKGIAHELYAETLSEGGIYVRKEEPFPVGSEVIVKLRLGEKGSIKVKGTVIYTKKLFGDFLTLPPGMAIAFDRLRPEDTVTLKSYIEDLVAKDIFESQKEELFQR
jgi:CheY-like chemotaxis protein